MFNGVRPSKAEHKEEGEQKDAGGRPRHPDTHWWAEEKKSKAGEEWSGRAAENWGVTGGQEVRPTPQASVKAGSSYPAGRGDLSLAVNTT